MKTTKFYTVSYNNGNTDDGMALCQAESWYLTLDGAKKYLEEHECDYITPDGKLHHLEDGKYTIVNDPSEYYREVEGGVYLEVDVIDETRLYFQDVPEDKVITIEIED